MRNKLWMIVLGLLMACHWAGCVRTDQDLDKAKTKTVNVEVTDKLKPGLLYEHWYFTTAKEAVEEVLRRTEPQVIGFGEFHQTTKTTGTLSALERFRGEIFPAFSSRISDLLVETWLSEGNCGEREKAVVGQVNKVSERPKETENENLALLKTAKKLGVQPHILKMSCSDYAKVMKDAEVDYVEMLALVARRLEEKSESLLLKKKDKILAVYSGAIHNDLEPAVDFADFTYAPKVARVASGKYVEIDLLVPEFVEASKIAKLELWYPQFMKLVSTQKVVLLKIGAASYIVAFRKGIKVSFGDNKKTK